MSDQVVAKKRRSPCPPMPDLAKVEKWSMLRMSDDHIRILLKLNPKQFDRLKEETEFKEALDRGRIKAIEACATILLKAIQGELLSKDGKFTEVQMTQLNTAKMYLKKHAPEWLGDFE